MSALMEITLTQSYQNQICVNRWNYVASGTPAAVTFSFALVHAFGAIFNQTATPPGYPPNTIIAWIRQLQSGQVTFQAIEARRVYSETDFYTTGFAPPLIGVQGGDASPPFVAYGFRSSRIRTDVRRGQKRFVGTTESTLGPGGQISAPTLTDMNQLAQRMSAVLTYNDEGNTLTFTPCIVAKQRYAVPGQPGRFAYRYIPPEQGGEAAQLAKCAIGISWEPRPMARSQTSRQYGRGI